jgi:dTDP-4-dehydrorhamnose 3,5-epimerase
MKIEQTPIQGLLVIQPRVFEDPRGYFFEPYNTRAFKEAGISAEFVQDNQSLSHRGVLRGLHFQRPPFAQAKLVRVITGSVMDIVVDIRTQSATYGQYHAVLLSAVNKTLFYVPEGFAHGFVTLEDHTIFSYKCAGYYDKSSEDTLLWNDPALGIDWGIENPILSAKDVEGKLLKDLNSPF